MSVCKGKDFFEKAPVLGKKTFHIVLSYSFLSPESTTSARPIVRLTHFDNTLTFAPSNEE